MLKTIISILNLICALISGAYMGNDFASGDYVSSGIMFVLVLAFIQESYVWSNKK